MAYVRESSYCFADLHYSKETVPLQSCWLFSIFVNHSNMKLLAPWSQCRSSPWITLSLEFSSLECTGIMGVWVCSHQLLPVCSATRASWKQPECSLVAGAKNLHLQCPWGNAPGCCSPPPCWLNLELVNKHTFASMAMLEVVKMKEKKSEPCWGLQGWPSATLPRLARGL